MIKKIYEGIKLSKKTEKIYELNEKQKEELNKIKLRQPMKMKKLKKLIWLNWVWIKKKI